MAAPSALEFVHVGILPAPQDPAWGRVVFAALANHRLQNLEGYVRDSDGDDELCNVLLFEPGRSLALELSQAKNEIALLRAELAQMKINK